MSQAPSGFDPNLFLQAQQTEANVRRPPLPVENPASTDGFYTAVIGEVKVDAGTISKGERMGQPWLMMIVPLQIEVPQQVQAQMGVTLAKGSITLTDRVMIDLTPQHTIDNSVGRNGRQRQYRDAMDMNKPGDVFSWQKAQGQVIKVKVNHEMYNNEVQEKVGAVARRS